MSIEQAIINMAEKNLEEMRKNINAALTQKAASSLENLKQEMANQYFGSEK